MRISSAALLAFLVASCGREAGAPQGDTIDCAIGPGAEFADQCVLERRAMEQGRAMLVIHHPGGGFRRFVRERSTLLPLDGAEPLVMIALDAASGIEFSVAGDRYRLPPASEPQ